MPNQSAFLLTFQTQIINTRTKDRDIIVNVIKECPILNQKTIESLKKRFGQDTQQVTRLDQLIKETKNITLEQSSKAASYVSKKSYNSVRSMISLKSDGKDEKDIQKFNEQT